MHTPLLPWLALHKPVKSLRKSLKSFGGRAAHKIPEVPTKAFADKDFPPVSISVHRHIERAVGNVKKTMRMTTGG